MANIKSAKKRIIVTEKRTLKNRAAKSALKTQLKKYDVALASNEDVDAVFNATIKSVDNAATKGIIHKNKANRTKAQLAKKLNAAKAE